MLIERKFNYYFPKHISQDIVNGIIVIPLTIWIR